MRSVLFLFGFLFSLTSTAQIYRTSSKTQNGEKTLRVYYSENGHHYRDTIVVHSDGYQDRLKREILSLQTWQAERQQEGRRYSVPAISLQTQSRSDVLWKATNAWDEAWEKKFGEWIDSSVDKSFMVKHKLSTDCADAMIAFRWIFARIHRLPAANTLSGGSLFTNESFRSVWSSLPSHSDWDKDQRFLKALDYVLDSTYTHSLEKDSYPLKIDRQFFFSGTVHLSLNQTSGHTMIVHKVAQSDREVPFYVYYSNLPKTIRELYVQIYYGNRPRIGFGGFMRSRWPTKAGGTWKLLDPKSHPAFSEEQYEESFAPNGTSYALAIYRRLFPNFDVLITLQALLDGLREQILQRVKIVEDGYAFCQVNDCSPGTVGDEDWSTPTRDQRILDGFDALSMFQMLDPSGSAQALSDKFLHTPLLSFDGYDFTPNVFIQFALRGRFASPDPRVAIESRWGLTPSAVARKTETDIRQALRTRETKINSPSGACNPSKPMSPDCLYLSQNWLEASTEAEDTVLTSYSGRLANYCAYVKTACPTLAKLISAVQVTANGKSQSLEKWLADGEWFLSDPRLPVGERWEGRRDKFHWVSFENFCDVVVGKNNRAVVGECQRAGPPTYRLVELDLVNHTTRDLFPSQTFRGISLLEDGKTAVLDAGAGLRRFDLDTKIEIAGFDSTSANCTFLAATRDHVACRTDKFMIIREWTTGNEVLRIEIGDYVIVSPDVNYLGTQVNGSGGKFISWDSNFKIIAEISTNNFASFMDRRFVRIQDEFFEIVAGKLKKFVLPAHQTLIQVTEYFVIYKENKEFCVRSHASTTPYYCLPEAVYMVSMPYIAQSWLSVTRGMDAGGMSQTTGYSMTSHLLDLASGRPFVTMQSQTPAYFWRLNESPGALIRKGNSFIWMERK